jgi:OOP family OmpA-OmpF porin
LAFCTKCGKQLGEGVGFCTNCGARVEAPANRAPAPPVSPTSPSPAVVQPSAAPASPQPAAAPTSALAAPQPVPPQQSGNLLLKIVVGVLAFFALVTVLVIGSCVYIGYRVKKKAERIQAAYQSGELAKKAGRAGTSSHTGGGTIPQPTAAAPSAKPASPSASLPGMANEFERTVGGPEADLLVRVGAVNNFGFGWPQGFDPFSGNSTPPHDYPWTPYQGAPVGMKRILIGSVVTGADQVERQEEDGYSNLLHYCYDYMRKVTISPCRQREETMPQPISIAVGDLPPRIDAVLFQMFVDDFQAPVWHSHFQVSLNGTRIPNFEEAINSLDQTGPIGKLVTLNLLPEYWPLLRSGTVKLLIDDPLTHVPDGYSIDFVRILVNPHAFKYQVTLEASVTDADKHSPIAGATVAAALVTATSDRGGHCTLRGLPAGLVTAMASAPGYDQDSVAVDLIAGQSGRAEFKLKAHQEGTAALEKSIAETGSATVYGIHFDSDSSRLRPDSTPTLNAILGLLKNHPQSRWIIAGHTDNQGSASHNQTLSEARAQSVVGWLEEHGVDAKQMAPQGFGATRPVANNATANGRALNRRVELVRE